MTLSAGSRLGPYEIVAKLGAGGMGEVWRARDLHLGRDVALKVLPEGFTRDPDRLARFEREARLLAQLNHPNVAQIYDLETSGETRALVMELVEGQTLAERLESGPLPLDESLSISLQIVHALAEAHEKGIVHRDLKPQNVKASREGRVKVLDFGLAKASSPLAADSPSAIADAETEVGGTRAGTILGTVGYMAPEQVRGEAVDGRADIFSFGCVLLEMLSGRRAFARPTAIETLTAILRDEPPEPTSPRGTLAPGLVRLVARCLEKEPGARFQTARELAVELEACRAATVRSPPRAGRQPQVAMAALLAAAVVVAFVWSRHRISSPPSPPALRVTQLTFAEGLEESPAMAPDGRTLVFSAGGTGVRRLVLRDLASGAERELTASAFDDLQPAWFPDGRRLLFVRARTAGIRLEPGDIFGQFQNGDIWELDLESARAMRRIENAFHPAVSPDGARIAFDAGWVGGARLWLADANGSNPEQLTRDSSEAISHLRPRWSPDGRRIVFHAQERTKFDIRLVEVATKRTTTVTDDNYIDVDPVFGASPDAVYFSSHRSGGLNLWRVELGPEGALIGAPRQITTGAGQDVGLSLDRSGQRGAFSTLRQNADLWTLPLDPLTSQPAGAPRELTASSREESRGAWSPDGRSVAFNSDRGGEMNLWLFDLASGRTRQLTRGPGGDYQANWSPDSKSLFFFSSRAGSVDLWSVDVTTGEIRQLTRDPGMEINPSASPDGRQLAYQADRSGRLELWIANADGSAPGQLSEEGVTGHFERWIDGGRSILFRCVCGGRNVVQQVSVAGGPARDLPWVRGGSHLSLSPDEERILDVLDHKTLWISQLAGGEARAAFHFDDSADRIDYPVWSPDGRAALFDRFRPEDGDLWMLEEGR